MLKKKARVTNPNAVLDFSYCRDLNGRRMLYVNAEVAIKKWKERLNKLEELKATNPNATLADVEMDAPKAGVYGWYCDVPGWAEGVKRSRSKFLREQKKQKMCERWWKAHQGKVPPNADKHWGCPRRDQCDFAHGLDELTGEGRAAFLREQERLKKEKEKEAIADYVSYDSMAGDAMKAVEAGLARRREEKRSKKMPLPLEDLDFGPRVKKTKKSVETSVSRGVASSSGEAFASRLRLLSGSATLQDDGIVMAESRFPSVRLGDVAVVTGSYYFELYVLTEGLVQVGWSGRDHGCDEDAENGVGDSEASWAFDVARGRKWHGDAEGEAYGEVCCPGDVVGVLLDADKRTLSFSRNGKDLGVAFTDVTYLGGLFPVVSLEKEETVLVNLGQFQFEYEPLEKATSVWEFAKKVYV
ncbi:hypothetical protein WA538_005570 [Blastocystis sp. DL]